jgi:hypothetical protein
MMGMTTAPWTKHLRPTPWVTALGLAALLSCAGSAWAADGEDPPFIEGVLSALGIKQQTSIDYRERSPLVVPPTRDMPPPVAEQKHSAWPADLTTRSADSATSRTRKVEWAKDNYSESKVAEPSDLTKIFSGGVGSAFSSFGRSGRDEVATFKSEPRRTTLTSPPAGYQTPSRAAPYGLTKPGEFDKVHQLEEPPPDKY